MFIATFPKFYSPSPPFLEERAGGEEAVFSPSVSEVHEEPRTVFLTPHWDPALRINGARS